MPNLQRPVTDPHAKHASHLRMALVTETFAPEVNGVAMTLSHLVQGLRDAGHGVQLVRPRQTLDGPAWAGDQDGGAAFGTSPAPGLDQVLVRGVPIPNYGGLRFGLPCSGRLRRLWTQTRPDVVHVATEGPLGWSALSAARDLHLPVTSSFHTNFDSYSQHYRLGLLKAPIESYLRLLHNRTLATMAPTQAMIQALRARGYRNLALLPRGVAVKQFSPARRSAALRAQWGVRDGDLVALHVGRLAPEKNIEVVLRAYRTLAARQPSTRLVLVGDGPLRRNLQETCPDVIFPGQRTGEELAAYYASGDLFLFPSLTETYGNVVPEAMASGLAVLSYRRAAAELLITHGRNGMLADEGDAAQFCDLAIALAGNPWLRRALRERAAASVAHLDWSSVCHGFTDQLRGAIERHRLAGDVRQAHGHSVAAQA